MRSLRKSLFAASLACAAALCASREASADPPPPRAFSSLVAPASLALATPRANVASLAPLSILPVHPAIIMGGYSASRPLKATGFVVFGLGLSTLAASGIVAIVAASYASRLDKDCPGKVCVEGTDGADTLHKTQDTALATDWLLGIGAPVTASGIVMLLYSAVVDRYGLTTMPRPVFNASPGGGSLAFSF